MVVLNCLQRTSLNFMHIYLLLCGKCRQGCENSKAIFRLKCNLQYLFKRDLIFSQDVYVLY